MSQRDLAFGGDLAILLGWATIELAYSFPFNRPLPWRFRLPGLLWAGTTLVLGRAITGSDSRPTLTSATSSRPS